MRCDSIFTRPEARPRWLAIQALIRIGGERGAGGCQLCRHFLNIRGRACGFFRIGELPYEDRIPHRSPFVVEGRRI